MSITNVLEIDKSLTEGVFGVLKRLNRVMNSSCGDHLLDKMAKLGQQNGLGFLKTHWMQTLGYFEALIIVPIIGLSMKRIFPRSCAK